MKNPKHYPLRHLKQIFIMLGCIALVACQESSPITPSLGDPTLLSLTEDVSIDFKVTADWNTGDGSRAYTGTINIKNNSDESISDWILGFNIKGSVISAWDADFKQDGEKVKLSHKSYNSKIKVGETLTVGFEGRYAGASIQPRKFYLNGKKVGDHGDPPPLPNPTDNIKVTFEKSADWVEQNDVHGFTAKITFTNTSSQNIDPWMIEFDFDATLTQMWDGRFEDRNGHFIVTDADWNSRLAPGESFSFGFNGRYSGSFKKPTDYLINRRPTNMATLISIAQRDPGVNLLEDAARNSQQSVSWSDAIAAPIGESYVLLAPVGELAATLIITIEEEKIQNSVFQWKQAPGFPVCNTTNNATLYLEWKEFLQVGYSLPYDNSECAAHNKSDIFSATITDSQSIPLKPIATRLSFKDDGSVESGARWYSKDTSNLTELVTLGSTFSDEHKEFRKKYPDLTPTPMPAIPEDQFQTPRLDSVTGNQGSKLVNQITECEDYTQPEDDLVNLNASDDSTVVPSILMGICIDYDDDGGEDDSEGDGQPGGDSNGPDDQGQNEEEENTCNADTLSDLDDDRDDARYSWDIAQRAKDSAATDRDDSYRAAEDLEDDLRDAKDTVEDIEEDIEDTLADARVWSDSQPSFADFVEDCLLKPWKVALGICENEAAEYRGEAAGFYLEVERLQGQLSDANRAYSDLSDEYESARDEYEEDQEEFEQASKENDQAYAGYIGANQAYNNYKNENCR